MTIHHTSDSVKQEGQQEAPVVDIITRRERTGRARVVLGTDEARVADEVIEELATRKDLFARGKDLVRFAHTCEGQAVVQVLSAVSIRDIITDCCDLFKVSYRSNKEEWTPKNPPEWLAPAIRERGRWEGMRPLAGIATAPFMRPDGTICQAPGYDETTRVYYAPGEDFFAVDDAECTIEHARASLAILVDAFCDFPFATDADRMAVIALPLTLLARPSIDGPCPMFVIQANTPGTGKSLCADVASIIAIGNVAARDDFTINPEEMAKRLQTVARSARPLMFLDNVNLPLGGSALDACLTSQRVGFRLLGSHSDEEFPWSTVIAASGNNVMLKGDTPRRAMLATLAVDVERPEDRQGWKHDPIKDWARKNRARLVHAALTILRCHARFNWPMGEVEPLGSYEDWSKRIAAAIAWAGGTNPLETRKSMVQEADDTGSALETLLTWWAGDTAGKNEKYSAASLLKQAEVHETLMGALESLDGGEGRLTSKRVGSVLKKMKGRLRGGRKLENKMIGGYRVWFPVGKGCGPGNAEVAGNVGVPPESGENL